MWVRRACVCLCVEQKNVRPLKYLQIQLNYITAISLARERSVIQLRVIFVMVSVSVSVLFKTTGELVSSVKLNIYDIHLHLQYI